MSVEFFLDTNVLVYSFDETAPAKREKSQALIEAALRSGHGAISWQVVQEFLNVALRKWERPMTPTDAVEYLGATLAPLCSVFPTTTIWRSALSLQIESQYRFYDSLIVASALQCGAKILYSEDLQSGRRFGNLELRDPFA
jgi:predicted nucleic acid-binding protein